MRMLALPAALLLSAALYSLFPALPDRLDDALRVLLLQIRRLFTTKRGRTDSKSALAVYLLLIAAAATLLCAIHPVASAIVMAPLFTGFCVLPQATAAKQELDSGKYSGDAVSYERRVLDACLPLGSAFAIGIVAPMLLCAIGIPLRVGCAPAWVFAGLCAIREEIPAVKRFISPVERTGDAILVFFFHLCAGLVGRNPLRIGGHGAKDKLMHLLSLEGEVDHAPISGDITQAVFLCCLCTFLLCAILTGIGVLLV